MALAMWTRRTRRTQEGAQSHLPIHPIATTDERIIVAEHERTHGHHHHGEPNSVPAPYDVIEIYYLRDEGLMDLENFRHNAKAQQESLLNERVEILENGFRLMAKGVEELVNHVDEDEKLLKKQGKQREYNRKVTKHEQKYREQARRIEREQTDIRLRRQQRRRAREDELWDLWKVDKQQHEDDQTVTTISAHDVSDEEETYEAEPAGAPEGSRHSRVSRRSILQQRKDQVDRRINEDRREHKADISRQEEEKPDEKEEKPNGGSLRQGEPAGGDCCEDLLDAIIKDQELQLRQLRYGGYWHRDLMAELNSLGKLWLENAIGHSVGGPVLIRREAETRGGTTRVSMTVRPTSIEGLYQHGLDNGVR
jgi:hypothetical protein